MAKGKIVLGFQVDRQMLEATDRLARETDRSRSAVVRVALRELIERRENNSRRSDASRSHPG